MTPAEKDLTSLAGHQMTLTLPGDQLLFIHALTAAGIQLMTGKMDTALAMAAMAAIQANVMGQERTDATLLTMQTQLAILRTIQREARKP